MDRERCCRELRPVDDIDAMITSDIDDRAKFYPPNGRFYIIRREDANVGVGCLKRITSVGGWVSRMQALQRRPLRSPHGLRARSCVSTAPNRLISRP
jgi:hypothetical protein